MSRYSPAQSGGAAVATTSPAIDKPINPNAIWGVNAANPLTTPTYDGSGQGTHCDVVEFASAWNGYKYWMAFTPFAGSDDDLENPSVIASNDGITWAVPTGLTNPIEPVPTNTGDYNSDTDMIYNPKDGKLYLFWRFRKQVDEGSGRYDRIYYKSSSDGVTWSAKQEWMTFTTEWCLSPAFVYDEDLDKFFMWYVSSDPIPATTIDPYTDGVTTITALGVKMMSSSSLTSGWSAAQLTNLTGNFLYGNTHVWHLDAIYAGGHYHLLLNSKNKDLYVAVSKDGLEWDYPSSPSLEKSTGSVWDNGIYRSSMTFVDGSEYRYKLWYSGLLNTTWRIGYTDLYAQKTGAARYVNNPKNKQSLVGMNSSDKGIIQVGRGAQDSSGEVNVSRFGDENSPLALWNVLSVLAKFSGELEVSKAGGALIRKSPDGSRWSEYVDNAGATVRKKILTADSFARSDSATSLGNAENGNAWTAYGGATFGIKDGQAYNVNGTNNGFAVYDTLQANGRIVVTLANFNGDLGIYFRATDAQNCFRFVRSGGTAYLQKYQASSSPTTLASGAISIANGDIMSVEMTGDVITCFLNGAQILTATDAFNNTNTRHGIGNATGNTNGRWDNFRIEQI